MPNVQAILDKINHSIIDDADIERAVNVLRSGFLSKPDGGTGRVLAEKDAPQVLPNLRLRRYLM